MCGIRRAFNHVLAMYDNVQHVLAERRLKYARVHRVDVDATKEKDDSFNTIKGRIT